MPAPMATSEYPDVIEEMTWPFQVIALGPNVGLAMLYFPGKPFVVDELWYWIGDGNTAGALTFRRVPSGSAIDAGTLLATISSLTAASTAKLAPTLDAAITYPISFGANQGLGVSITTATTGTGFTTFAARIRTRLT